MIVWFLVMGGVGMLLGSTNGNVGAGFILGCLLGPIGWLLVLAVPPNKN